MTIFKVASVVFLGAALGVGYQLLSPPSPSGSSPSSDSTTKRASSPSATFRQPEVAVIKNHAEAATFLRRAILNRSDSSLASQALVLWAKQNPEEALDFFATETPILQGSRFRTMAFEAILAKLGLEAVEKRLLEISDTGRQKANLRNLFSALASSEPREALKFAKKHQTWVDSRGLETAFRLIASESPTEAFQLALEVPSEKQRGALRLAIADQWGDQDPQAVLAWLKNEHASPLRDLLQTQALADLARLDFGSAKALATGTHELTRKREAWRAVLRQKLKEDPNEALALFDEINSGNNKYLKDTVAAAMNDLLSLSPELVAQMLSRPDLKSAGHAAAKTYLEREVLRDPDAVLAFIESLPEAARAQLDDQWYIQMIDVDPKVAAQRLLANGADQHNSDSIGGLATNLALADPEFALAWASKIDHPTVAEAARYHTLRMWAEQDPEATAQALEEIDPADRQHAISYIGQSWAEHDPEKALSWIYQLEDQEVLTSALGETLAISATQDVSFAKDEFASALQAIPDLSKDPAAMTAAIEIGSAWEGDRLADGPQWLDTLPEGEIRTEAARGLMEPLAQQNPLDLYETVQAIEHPDLRDAGLRLVTQNLYGSDLEGAFSVATQINNNAYRLDTLQVVLGDLFKADPQQTISLINTDPRIPQSDIPALKTYLGLE